MAIKFDADNIGRFQAFTHTKEGDEKEQVYRICTATGDLRRWEQERDGYGFRWVKLDTGAS